MDYYHYEPIALENKFNFVGTSKPENPKDGDIYIDIETGNINIWVGIINDWEPTIDIEPKNPVYYDSVCYYKEKEKIIAITCSHCGAPSIKGHKCEYCGGYN